MPKRVLVTGIMGQTSKYLIDELRKDGWKIVGTDILPRDKKVFDGPYVQADLTNPEELKGLLKHAPYDAVIHTAAIVDFLSMKLYQVNVVGTENLFKVLSSKGCLNKGAVVINISTASVYMVSKKLIPLSGAREDHHVGLMRNPFENYVKSKLLQEEVGFKYHGEGKLNVITVRLGLVYSRGSIELIGDMVNAVALGMGHLINSFMPEFKIGLVSAKNVARAEAHLLKHGKPGEIYNITDGKPISFVKFIGLIAKCFDGLIKKALAKRGRKVPGKSIVPYKSILSDEIKRREFIATGAVMNSRVFKLAISRAYGGLELPKMLVVGDILGFMGRTHWVFNIDKIKSTGWKPEGCVEDAIEGVLKGMLEDGSIVLNNISWFRVLELGGKGYDWFLLSKYEMDPELNPFHCELAWRNRNVGWSRKWNPKPNKAYFRKCKRKIDAHKKKLGRFKDFEKERQRVRVELGLMEDSS